jgi:biopolymer transport protein ExbB
MDTVLNVLVNWNIIDIFIIGLGFFGAVLIMDRFKAFYVDYTINTDEFMKTVMGLLSEDKTEEAVTFCSANAKKPLAHVIKRILEKCECQTADITQAYDTASSEVAPGLIKRLGHLQMISNVVTLVGLLGTVIGLIMSFKAVSFADVSQKQTLLAEGISMAMHATALGLLVAIPVMVVYSFLHDKQNKLFSEIDRCANQVLEHLRLRYYHPFTAEAGYPTNLNSSQAAEKMGKAPKMPPSPPKIGRAG